MGRLWPLGSRHSSPLVKTKSFLFSPLKILFPYALPVVMISLPVPVWLSWLPWWSLPAPLWRHFQHVSSFTFFGHCTWTLSWSHFGLLTLTLLHQSPARKHPTIWPNFWPSSTNHILRIKTRPESPNERTLLLMCLGKYGKQCEQRW